MPIIVLKVVALIFQRIERLIFNLPPGSSASHEVKDIAPAHSQVGHPTEVLDLLIAYLPVFDEIDPHVHVRGIEWHIIDKPKAMAHPCSAVVSLIKSHAPSLLGRLHLLEQKAMIAFFDAEDIVQRMLTQGLEVRSIGTQAVFGDDELEVRVILAQFDDKPFGSITFAIIFVRAILLPDRFRHQGNHGTHVGMDDRCAQHLMRIRHRTVAMYLVQTRGTVNGRGGKIPRAIEGQKVGIIEKRQRFQRLAALELPKDALEHRAEPLGRDLAGSAGIAELNSAWKNNNIPRDFRTRIDSLIL